MVSATVSTVNPTVNPTALATLEQLIRSDPRAAGVLGMLARKLQAWPRSQDYWAEVSSRFAARGLGLSHGVAYRVLIRVVRAIGARDWTWRAVLAATGLDVRRGRKGPLFGTVWRVGRDMADALLHLLRTGRISWCPPNRSRTWYTVRGLDTSKTHGTCWCPHPHCQATKPRAAWCRHDDGTYHITCQLCEDGAGRRLTWFARDAEHGMVEATLVHRCAAQHGRNGGDDCSGALTQLQQIASYETTRLGTLVRPQAEPLPALPPKLRPPVHQDLVLARRDDPSALPSWATLAGSTPEPCAAPSFPGCAPESHPTPAPAGEDLCSRGTGAESDTARALTHDPTGEDHFVPPRGGGLGTRTMRVITKFGAWMFEQLMPAEQAMQQVGQPFVLGVLEVGAPNPYLDPDGWG